MGWEKGKKRGPSPLQGRKVLDIDPSYLKEIMDDSETTPEIRFCAVMELLLEAMAESTNKITASVGTTLRAFWGNEMERTIIYTPEVIDVQRPERDGADLPEL